MLLLAAIYTFRRWGHYVGHRLVVNKQLRASTYVVYFHLMPLYQSSALRDSTVNEESDRLHQSIWREGNRRLSSNRYLRFHCPSPLLSHRQLRIIRQAQVYSFTNGSKSLKTAMVLNASALTRPVFVTKKEISSNRSPQMHATLHPISYHRSLFEPEGKKAFFTHAIHRSGRNSACNAARTIESSTPAALLLRMMFLLHHFTFRPHPGGGLCSYPSNQCV
ncbi:hypothetical protein BX666DRAFT_61811 [Dichotomocladium elegans]|nr:hypothetical protein BX666DRAFT_61811 [Dichotomocladium elegans]